MLLHQGEEKAKGYLMNISKKKKKLALVVDDSDLQFCIIGSSLYKSAPLHSISPSRWYISKKFHLNVTLKACHAQDHSKCQNSPMWPVTEFRISLFHMFLKQISKTKLCLWNLDSDLCCYSLLAFQSTELIYQFSSAFKAQYAWKKLTSFERINVTHGCILDFNSCTDINSFTECREK